MEKADQVSSQRHLDPLNRFTSRVENYVKYRPGYPAQIIQLLEANCGFSKDSLVADIGSGTGILSEVFLKNGNHVLAVEPNAEMRRAGEAVLNHYPNFKSISGTAEATTLTANSIDFITAGQAFHWFDPTRTRLEFERILKADGWVVLIWNERRLSSTTFLQEYEALLMKFGLDYQQVRHENVEREIGSFYEPASFDIATFDNSQKLDLNAFRGRALSSSYTPEPDHPAYQAMLSELDDI